MSWIFLPLRFKSNNERNHIQRDCIFLYKSFIHLTDVLTSSDNLNLTRYKISYNHYSVPHPDIKLHKQQIIILVCSIHNNNYPRSDIAQKNGHANRCSSQANLVLAQALVENLACIIITSLFGLQVQPQARYGFFSDNLRFFFVKRY